MSKPGQISAKHRKNVLKNVVLWTRHRHEKYAESSAKLNTPKLRTGIAESFELVELNPKKILPHAPSEVGFEHALHPLKRWHHQLLIMGVASYGESIAEEEDGPLGTLVIDSPIAAMIDSQWQRAISQIPASAVVRLMRIPDRSIVSFVATLLSYSLIWIVAAPNSKRVERWMSVKDFIELLNDLPPTVGYTVTKRSSMPLHKS